MTYLAPVEAMALTLNDIAGLASDAERGAAGEFSADMLTSILEEAGCFASDRLEPRNREGDKIGATLKEGAVSLPPGWPALYQEWAQAGWNGVDLPADWGGMGLPTRMATAVMEIWTSANMAFAMCPVLTQGAVDALILHASRELNEIYLPKLVSGEWTATMNLTEPQAGSDLGALRTRAQRQEDGTYRLSGNKIFISWGEHDFSDNIIHLVLARLPDAPPGTKGISLFLVPKFLVNPDGSLGARNDITCTGIEHKLGIHASPTCSMSFGEQGGAIGWLVGEENRGLNCMFTMMNKARLFTGLQGVAIGERAYQMALAFAQERKQGRALGAPVTQSSPIIEHPDVQRNLATMRALTSACRAIAYAAAHAIDLAHSAPDEAERAYNDELAGLLTPITKSWCSDMGFQIASIGVQIHGGMGYVEETGAAQLLRDARIPPIYEGTNGIQAIDLLLRKVLRPGSTIALDTIKSFVDIASQAANSAEPDVAACAAITREACEELTAATQWLVERAANAEQLLWAASPYLELWALASGAAYLTKGADAAARAMNQGQDSPARRRAIADARFFAETTAIKAASLTRIITSSVRAKALTLA